MGDEAQVRPDERRHWHCRTWLSIKSITIIGDEAIHGSEKYDRIPYRREEEASQKDGQEETSACTHDGGPAGTRAPLSADGQSAGQAAQGLLAGRERRVRLGRLPGARRSRPVL